MCKMIFLFEDGRHLWAAQKVTVVPHGRYILSRLAPQADGHFQTREICHYENFYSMKERILEINKKISGYAPEKAVDEKILSDKLFTLRG